MAATAAVPGWSPAKPSQSHPIHFILLYGALYTVAIGTGGIKPNVSSFGADQFDDKIREERKQKQSFFNWFYFSINVGSLLACTVIVDIQVRAFNELRKVCELVALVHGCSVADGTRATNGPNFSLLCLLLTPECGARKARTALTGLFTSLQSTDKSCTVYLHLRKAAELCV